MFSNGGSFNGASSYDTAGSYPVQTKFFAQLIRWNDRPGKRS